MAYIDQRAAVDAVKEVIGALDHECKSTMAFYSALWNVPAADVAPVVRCRECRYSTPPAKLTELYGEPGTLTCHHGPCNRRNVNENDFCSYGEKKNGDRHVE